MTSRNSTIVALLMFIVLGVANVVGAFQASLSPTKTEPKLVRWVTDMEVAQSDAARDGKLLLLLFTGSDWCPACKVLDHRLESEPEAARLVSENFVPVYLDYPRFELPAELKAQNEKLKYQFGIEAYPTIFIVDRELRVYKTFSGSVENIREGFAETSRQSELIQNALNGISLDECQDPVQLAKGLSAIPEEYYHRGWERIVERLVELSKNHSPTLHSEWVIKLARLKNDQYIASVESTFHRMYAEGATNEQILEYLEAEFARVNGDPDRLRMLWPKKTQVLSGMSRTLESVEFARTGLSAEWANPDVRQKLDHFLSYELARLGRVDEMREVIVRQLSSISFENEQKRELAVSQEVAARLYVGKQYSLLAKECEQLLQRSDSLTGINFLSTAYDSIGHDPLAHGHMLMQVVRALPIEHDETIRKLSFKAAVLFQGAGANDAAIAACQYYLSLTPNLIDSEEPVSFGAERPTINADSLTAARGRRGDAFLHLAKNTQGSAQAWYLIMASEAFKIHGNPSEAATSIEQAKAVLDKIPEHQKVDKAMFTKLEKRLSQAWPDYRPSNATEGLSLIKKVTMSMSPSDGDETFRTHRAKQLLEDLEFLWQMNPTGDERQSLYVSHHLALRRLAADETLRGWVELEMKAFNQRMSEDLDPEIRAKVMFNRFGEQTDHLKAMPAEERQRLIDEIIQLIAQRPATIEDARWVISIAEKISHEGDDTRASEFCEKLKNHFENHSDSEIQRMSELLKGLSQRFSLPGEEMKIVGQMPDGQSFAFSSLQGKVVLIDFWSVYCGPCIAEFPALRRYKQTYGPYGFEIVGINQWNGESQFKQYIEKNDLPWINLRSPNVTSSKMHLDENAIRYGVHSLPVTILIGRDGKVISLWARGEKLEKLLKEQFPGVEGPVEE